MMTIIYTFIPPAVDASIVLSGALEDYSPPNIAQTDMDCDDLSSFQDIC